MAAEGSCLGLPLIIFNNAVIWQSSSPTWCLESLPQPCGTVFQEWDFGMQYQSVEGPAKPQMTPGLSNGLLQQRMERAEGSC